MSFRDTVGTFSRFLFVGGIGFITDMVVYVAATHITGSPPSSRVIASLVAIFITWLFNRRITFYSKNEPVLREITRYYAASLLGASANFMVFYLSLNTFHLSEALSYMLGTGTGLVINYSGYALYVFKKKDIGAGNG